MNKKNINKQFKDNMGDNIKNSRANWSFGGDVANNFVDHVTKSVPGYNEGHEIICSLSDFFCLNESTCYELGVSTGELISKLARHNSHKKNIQWIGVDSENKMINKAKKHCKNNKSIQFKCEDIRKLKMKSSDFVVSYYVLQFIRPRDRQLIINKIYNSLNWGGAFVLFEKVRGPDARFQDILTNVYNNFKKKNGYSADEILNKTDSIKGVMEPFSTEGNLGLLKRSGFTDIMTIYKNICFEGTLCIK